MSERFDLKLPHGTLQYPVYLPDATFGVVRSVDAGGLEDCGVEGVVMNAFHLMQRPGSSTVQALGGLHRMSGWDKPIITDSGGFQAYSLIRQNPKSGTLTDKGLSFKPEGAKRSFQLTPEKTVQLQLGYGSDVVICLDDCTHVDDSPTEQLSSVERTIAWAKRGRDAFDRLVEQKQLDGDQRPKIFGVIQGGSDLGLRKRCSEALLEVGFDGYGYGGWPLDGDGNLLVDVMQALRQFIPPEYALHALGVGHPKNVLACWELGYDIFDSAMPTRDARHGRLYTFTQPAEGPETGLKDNWLKYIYINDEENIKANRPISPYCDCLCCRRYSLGYLRHLFKLNDSLFPKLATQHNLRFMIQLTERLRLKRKISHKPA
jgi:queuine tRNA-ribosyltransferase